MNAFVAIISLGLAIWIIYEISEVIKRYNKKQADLAIPFSDKWVEIVRKNLSPYQKLPEPLQKTLRDYVKLFLAEKSFEGCGGLEITDEIKVTIAAQACMLLLNRDTSCYQKLHRIIVYPATYLARENSESQARLGESWDTGTVVLSWNSVIGGALNFRDGQNVTMHEFAHQLDQEDGAADGAPILKDRSAYSAWAKIFSKEYETLRQQDIRGEKSVMYKYGATNPAEFFAVATETFFEKPVQLKINHPELYEELKDFYQLNPTEWI